MLFEPNKVTPTYALRKPGANAFNAVFFTDTCDEAKKLRAAYFKHHRVKLRIAKVNVRLLIVEEIE